MERKICPFKDIKDLECVGYIPECDDEKLTSILSQKRGIKRIQKASKARGTYVSVKLGMVVHKTCRAQYIEENAIKRYNKDKLEVDNTHVHNLRSSNSETFVYATHCLLCECIAVDENGEKQKDVYRVSTWDKEKTLKDTIKHRLKQNKDDEWAIKVKGTLAIVADLPSADAIYHRQCSCNFQNDKYVPNDSRTSGINEVKSVGRPKDNKRYKNQVKSVGRPKNNERYKAFQSVMYDFFENDDRTITISELRNRMGKICDPYSIPGMKTKLKEIEDIFISQIEGHADIVTTKVSTSKVLSNFHAKKKQYQERMSGKKK